MSPVDGTPRARRLHDRVPVRLRHHWKPAGALCAGLAVMLYAFGDARISPYVTSASRVEANAITDDVRGTVGLYDTSVRHSVQLEYQQTDFDKMMKEFKKDGTKDSIPADLTIDGVFLQDVGIRLKGNSTLMSLRGNRGGGPGGGRGGGPGGGQMPDLPAAGGRADGGDTPADGAAGARGGARGGGMTQYNLSADKPEELPWLIKIDEYVEGRAYQGEREISLRPGSNAQVPVNEALSLALIDGTGEPAERYSLSSLKVNNRPTAVRLMVENPDTEYAEAVEGESVVYKARAGGTFDYQGDDPSKYETSFRQLNKVGSQDLEPVMKLTKWVEESSDTEFAENLDKHVDVDSLAHYIAAQNLLMNFDDMAGPGKNYLLGYDLNTKKFSVLGWDYNLTFSGDVTAGPDDQMSMGGGRGGAGGQGDDAGGGMPEGMPELPEGVEMPGPGDLPGAPDGGAGGSGGAGGGGMRSGHALKTRFLGLDAFDDVYKKAYKDLYEKFYASGKATKVLADLTEQATRAGLSAKEAKGAVGTLRTTVTQRTAALAKDKEVAG
ncbi:CotH kinase family protein [Streptomyces sp. ITFR-6]|uniref:CotH kinase family protein n=1 Tax=Streptomyces sp. ITFR-6 TaxID=3075197 RepID=UPI00288ADA4C|nr:CotH kinase family protein [Streptomyces sp. ITFR-6]WNI28518.1 CotH kinase family protein [Streptomyces sp. ITFR-6]